ncbi:hypothetical protein QEZ54_17935 [Catellatospora sp. KI3]|uniref:hypothetical protein n=1 Tax=Catellatospora sp. KI3 TaxID=3041620 RepID=UPI002482CB1B|nr:hypothetical protein [Catellatospora sp. KI3]MDI1462859.1 hypothetical protein [Catellatospora sp. KI3]
MKITLRRLLPGSLGSLAGIACALCCLIPLLVAAGVLGGAGWAYLGDVMPGIALVLAALTGLAWWWASRRRAHATGCTGGACSCSQPS